MKMLIIKCCLFLLWMTRIEGFEKLWTPDDSIVNHKIMKTILELCYKNENLANPIVIIGDFKESIDESSVIILNEIYNFDEELEYEAVSGNISYAADKIILIEDSPEKLESHLKLLEGTSWWNHLALFFIIEKNVRTCEYAMDMLLATWKIDILNSIYICTESNNTTSLYTFNPIANYAPLPWKRKEEHDHLYMFHQMFDSNIACESLHYDKTKNLHGYVITVIFQDSSFPYSWPRRTYFHLSDESLKISPLWIILRSIFKSWNATARFDIVDSPIIMKNRFEKVTADISIGARISDQYMKAIIPIYCLYKFIAVGKWHQEVSTLIEIRQSWCYSVFVITATVLVPLLIMLTIQRSHKFGMYFAKILIFIVIAYGVFQGFTLTFLIKPERVSSPQTLEELLELEYIMRTDSSSMETVAEICPTCDVGDEKSLTCTEFIRNKSHHICLLWTPAEMSTFNALNWDFIEEPILKENTFFYHRQNWPLRNGLIDKTSRIFESGLLNFWTKIDTEQNLDKHPSQEDESSLSQYKPLKLNELTFAFKVLGLGLSISTIVFFIELIVAKDWMAVFEIYFG